jgi:hypothetical protein
MVRSLGVTPSRPGLAVGEDPQAGFPLQRYQLDNRLVLDLAQFRLGQRAGLARGAGLQQPGRAQQAADVLGVVRSAHVRSTLLSPRTTHHSRANCSEARSRCRPVSLSLCPDPHAVQGIREASRRAR